MQSLSRLLTIDSAVLSTRSIWRTLPRPIKFESRHVFSRRITCSGASGTPQNGASPEGEEPSPTTATALPTPETAAIGQVMAAQANFVRVKIDHLEGSDLPPPQPRLLCVVRALLKKIKREVLVGDKVRIVGIDWTDGRGMVEEVLPRDSRLTEPPVANVNHVLLVFASAMPPMQPSAATRYLVAAEAAGLPITVVLNKADLLDEEEAQALQDRIAAWGYKAVSVSVVNQRGIAELEESLRGTVTVVAGPSGAGKSSIINALRLRAAGLEGTLETMAAQPSGWQNIAQQEGEDSDREDHEEGEESEGTGGNTAVTEVSGVELQAVGSVSERIGRGKHTTRNVMLVAMGGGGLLVDTPGFNQPTVVLPPTELAQHFPEIRAALEHERCAFSNCQHIAEPGCVVRGGWERYELYAALHAELQIVDEESAKRASAKRQREGTVRMKSRGGGRMGVEAKLETKSHRRVSRRSVKQQLSELVKDVDDDDAVPL